MITCTVRILLFVLLDTPCFLLREDCEMAELRKRKAHRNSLIIGYITSTAFITSLSDEAGNKEKIR